ncbi:hypothetical protein AX774_g4262 [Zancudomyces culisetae]|uniref:Uncharacterized protein n=1 Tax=Zancudomyces culisetae TaxID=1213189 RepID=A0A1R1PMX7_ZANCU|nr:hypothetical protein AX774_g4262 [Zancudomyces culisetae]|eukprot:OMH82263.1 hypothetical protein AX774_g4262 [Zancudomyces culisetae]
MTNPQLLLIAKAIIDSSKVTGRLMKADSINFLRTSSLTHNIVNSRFPQNHFQNDNYVPSKENKSTGTDKINKSDLADKTETNVATSTANLKPEDSPSNEHPKTTQAPREDLSKIDTLNNFLPPMTKAKPNVNKGNDASEDNHTLNTIDEKVTTNDQNPDASEENTRSSIPKDNVVNEPHKKADLKESYIPSTRASRIYHYGCK